MNNNIKILITGANGYIGNCLYYFLKGKFKVIGIDKETTFNNKIYKCDILNIKKLKNKILKLMIINILLWVVTFVWFIYLTPTSYT